MVEEYCYPLTRTKLGDYYEMAWRCAKCAFCRNVLPSDTEDERFAQQCPCGVRFKFESYFASGRNELARRTIEGSQGLTEKLGHILYTCSTCSACEEWCQATQGLFPLKITMEMRKHFLANHGTIPEGHRQVLDNLATHHNRLGRNNRDRSAWLGSEIPAAAEDADIFYFVGCRSSFRRSEIAQNTYELLTKKLGLKVALFGDEHCCGRPLIDIGNEQGAVELMAHNAEQIRASGAKRVLFSCAECFHTFRAMDRYGVKCDFEPVHLTQFLAERLHSGKLRSSKFPGTVAFHDPCYLARHEGILEEPREVLSAIPEMELAELARNRKNTWCCGSGGGVQDAFPDLTHWTAVERLEEVKAANAGTLVSSCPGCKDALWSVARVNGVELVDLSELINRIVEV